MGRLRIVLRDAVWASVAGTLQSLGPFGTFLILARLASSEELGRYALAVAVTAPVFLAARMQLRQAAVADPCGGASFWSYLRLRLTAATIALGAIAAFAQSLDKWSSSVVGAVALVRWSEEIGDIHYAPLQRAGRWPRIAASQTIRLGGALTLLALGWNGIGLTATLFCIAAWQAAVTLWFDAPLAHRLEPIRQARLGLGKLLRLNWSLGATACVVSLISYVPRYAVAWSDGEGAVGDYAALAQAALLGNLIVQGAGQASLGRLGVAYLMDRWGFGRLVRQLLLLAAIVAVGGLVVACLWGGVLLEEMFQPRFAALQGELMLMMAASLFVYAASVFGYALTAAGAKSSQLAVFGAALAVGVGASFPLSAAYGLPGAIAGYACSWATAALLSGLLLRAVRGAIDGHRQVESSIRGRAV